MPRCLSSLPVLGGPDALGILPALAAALDGSGPALAPYEAGGDPPRPPPKLPPHDPADVPDDLVVVVGTSGSTGRPKLAMLTASALAASAAATAQRLGGPGDWLLALPSHHVAGLQVLLRALAWDTTVVPLAPAGPGFTAAAFVAATERLRVVGGARAYVSLVPTQLVRLLADHPDRPDAVGALAHYDAVLLGGAAADPQLLTTARDAGARIVTTYGSSETCGGCVYGGEPLPGVSVAIGADDRILLCGPVLSAGYLGDPARTAQAFVARGGLRHFVTDDLGHVEASTGLLVVDGRVDDAITSGGLTVDPATVEAALRSVLPAGWDAAAVGLPDLVWGEIVAAAIAPPPTPPPVPGLATGSAVPAAMGDAAPDLARLREAVRDRLPAFAMPRILRVVPVLPTLAVGKTDRAALARTLSGIQ